MTVAEIAALTGYTARHIRQECADGLLKAEVVYKGQRPGFQIAVTDYQIWRETPPRTRRAWKGKR